MPGTRQQDVSCHLCAKCGLSAHWVCALRLLLRINLAFRQCVSFHSPPLSYCRTTTERKPSNSSFTWVILPLRRSLYWKAKLTCANPPQIRLFVAPLTALSWGWPLWREHRYGMNACSGFFCAPCLLSPLDWCLLEGAGLAISTVWVLVSFSSVLYSPPSSLNGVHHLVQSRKFLDIALDYVLSLLQDSHRNVHFMNDIRGFEILGNLLRKRNFLFRSSTQSKLFKMCLGQSCGQKKVLWWTHSSALSFDWTTPPPTHTAT